MLGWPLAGSVSQDSGDEITIVVASCRRSDSGGCLAASTLLARLAEAAVAREVLVTTGMSWHAYSPQDPLASLAGGQATSTVPGANLPTMAVTWSFILRVRSLG